MALDRCDVDSAILTGLGHGFLEQIHRATQNQHQNQGQTAGDLVLRRRRGMMDVASLVSVPWRRRGRGVK